MKMVMLAVERDEELFTALLRSFCWPLAPIEYGQESLRPASGAHVEAAAAAAGCCFGRAGLLPRLATRSFA